MTEKSEAIYRDEYQIVICLKICLHQHFKYSHILPFGRAKPTLISKSAEKQILFILNFQFSWMQIVS